MVFDKQWFREHQKKILWFANHPILKYWFRWVLRIQGDIKFREKIAQIQPNNYKVYLGQFLINGKLEHKVRADFRTNNKFSARLYHAFRPMWWTMHFMDWLCLDSLDYSFGFDTLIAYPDAGTGGTTVDGLVYRAGVNEAFSTLVAGAGNTINTTADYFLQLQASATTDQFQVLIRAIATFDTSSIGSGNQVDSAQISLYGSAKVAGLGTTGYGADIVSATPASDNNLVASDYSQTGSTAFASISYASISTGAYNDLTLNAGGETNVNKTGISRFGVKCSWDTDDNFGGSWVSNASTYASFESADTAGTSQDPKLTIEYSVGGGVTLDAIFFSHNF